MGKSPILIKLGLQIRAVRESKGLSQDEAAFKASLARSYYGDIERGTRNVAAINLVNIANALEVEVGELFKDVK